MNKNLVEIALTVGELVQELAEKFAEADVFCGHGTDNPRDEAASIVFHVMKLAHDDLHAYAVRVPKQQSRQIAELGEQRIKQRVPAPYLLNEAWFCGLGFYVDHRVLIPRSPFAELIHAAFTPWLEPDSVLRILEIGTGSGCIAIACARAFPASTVVATDISEPALEVAAINLARHGLEQRIELVQSDIFREVEGQFDLIVTNPPYVPEQEIDQLPVEYSHEPELALVSGPDGMESPRRILQDASQYLTDRGLLAIEVGAGWQVLEETFPAVPFVWPEFESGGSGIALAWKHDLPGS